MTLAIQFSQILALLVALTYLFGRIMRRWPARGDGVNTVLQSLLFASIAISGMQVPIQMAPGVILDGRVIVVSLAALFVGPRASIGAAVLVAAYRLHLGGIGAVPGVWTILVASAIGIIFACYWPGGPTRHRSLMLFCVGVVNAGVSVILFLILLPDPAVAWKVASRFGPMAAVFYPVTALVLGSLLTQEQDRLDTEAALRDLAHYAEQLRRITDAAFHEGEHAE